MQKITPFLWFEDQAEPAAKFYVSRFKHSKILRIARYEDEGAKATGRPKGTVMTVAFRLDGQEFTALNGGPVFKFSEAVSLVVNCRTQAEVDKFWQQPLSGRRKRPVRLAKGQIWPVLADRAGRPPRVVRRQGSRQIKPGDEGDAANDEIGHQNPEARPCRAVVPPEPESS